MKFTQHYSSSKGNLYSVTARNGSRLILECGVAWKEIQAALSYNLPGIEGCFLTHEHKDHSKGAKDIIKSGIPLFSSAGTFEKLGIAPDRTARIITNNTLIRLKSFSVFSFNVVHDAAEPLGFIVRENETGEFLLFVTDTSFIEQRFPYAFSIIAIECSYDYKILEANVASGKVNEELAKRLLCSHMEYWNCLQYVQNFCDTSILQELHLLHVSTTNLNRQIVQEAFMDNLFIEGTMIDGI